MNFDYDMKRRPVNVRNGPDGLIQFETEPWASTDEFLEFRCDFDAWRIACKSVLKTAEDWCRFLAWRAGKRTRSAAQRTPWQQHLLVLCATGRVLPLRGRGGDLRSAVRDSGAWTTAQIAALLTDAGVPAVTARIVKHAADREVAAADAPPPAMLTDDFSVVENLRRMLPPEAFHRLPQPTPQNLDQLKNAPLAKAAEAFDTSLKDNAFIPAPIEIRTISPNSLEGRVLTAPESPAEPGRSKPNPSHQSIIAAANANIEAEIVDVETPGAMREKGATDDTRTAPTASPAPPARPATLPTPPIDPRHDRPATTRAMDALVPLVEAALRRQGVTSRHLRIGREAARTDGTAPADIPMAALAHALAIREGLPVELAVVMIAGMIASDCQSGSAAAGFSRQGATR